MSPCQKPPAQHMGGRAVVEGAQVCQSGPAQDQGLCWQGTLLPVGTEAFSESAPSWHQRLKVVEL